MTYVNRESVVGVGVLFIILGTCAMAARIFVRRKTSSLAADDWFALIAWVCLTEAQGNSGDYVDDTYTKV